MAQSGVASMMIPMKIPWDFLQIQKPYNTQSYDLQF
jgi:hypothetical protein